MRTTITAAFAVILILAQVSALPGEEVGKPSDKARLQQALFVEEAERDLPKAAKEYEALVEEYTAARRIGLSALYRLAEVRRKQKRNDDAAKLYLRIVSEFPDESEARLSRENLTALGVGLPAAPSQIPDDPDETKELRRLMMLARNSPDQVWKEVPLALDNSGNQTTSPLSKAARRGWLRVVAFLAEQHKQSGREQRELDRALYSAAQAGQLESCRLLMKHGAMLAIAKHALVHAIQNNHQAVGDWLLERGVDVNTAGSGVLNNLDNRRRTGTDPYSGEKLAMPYCARGNLTPLGAAIAADDPEWVDRLLKVGVDVNNAGSEDDPVSISPLSIACWKGHVPLVKKLLELGADPNSPDRDLSSADQIRKPGSTAEGRRPLHYAAGDPEIIALLLAAGAEAKSADADGFTPLHAAACLNSLKSCSLLLEAGAVPDPAAHLPWYVKEDQQWTPLMLATTHASYEDDGAAAKEVIELLISRGANPSREIHDGKDIVDHCPVPELRPWLAELIRYPELARSQGITVALPSAPASLVVVEHPDDGSAPPSLAEALLAWTEPITLSGHQPCRTDRGTLRRSDGNGHFAKIPFEVLDIASHPELRWGDIIEFEPANPNTPAEVVSPRQNTERIRVSYRKSIALAPQVYLDLFAKSELKVTIAWPDRPRQELTLRGSLRVYDPGRAEAPLVSPRALLDLLGAARTQTMRITRSDKHGGGTIDVPEDRELRRGIRFLDGDLITVAPMDPDEAEESRRTQIQLLEPESGFRWVKRVAMDGSPSKEMSAAKDNSIKPAIYPTLLQFLTEFYLPLETFELRSMSEILNEEENIEQWSPDEIARAVRLSGVAPWATIRHPDLRNIWIQRLYFGERIRVPLAELIAETNEETPDEFYRNADIALLPGDIVEVRLLPDQGPDSGKGFDPETTQFIRKALSYDIQLAPTAEQQRSFRVRWIPPRWFETSAGPIAVAEATNKPLVMDVNHVGRKLTRRGFKWGLKERWLRQDTMIQESLGKYSFVSKNRMGGSSNSMSWPRHSGLDERGLLQDLRPRLFHSSTSSSRSSGRVPSSTPSGRPTRRIPTPPTRR